MVGGLVECLGLSHSDPSRKDKYTARMGTLVGLLMGAHISGARCGASPELFLMWSYQVRVISVVW